MSLKNQLMKAGLADAKKARRTEHEKRVQSKDPQAQTAHELAQQALAEKTDRDRELNRARDAELAQKALAAQIRQLIEAHRISRTGGDISYQFTDERKVKKLYVTSAQQEQLARGQIAIVRIGEGHELVPTIVAEKIKSRDSSAVVLLNSRTTTATTDDDPYAAYQIPDDLMW
jgi:uncharacterized protein YaiL (DUF2058 family)